MTSSRTSPESRPRSTDRVVCVPVGRGDATMDDMDRDIPPLAAFGQLPTGEAAFRIGDEIVRLTAVADGWTVTTDDPDYRGHLSAEFTTVIGEHAIEIRRYTDLSTGATEREIDVDVHEFKDLFF